ncbi:MAG: EAL domain-containing protein [Campylobacterales bacterium]|nr:EAL domain-containing protein [Campylobacterales bacterium]
MRPNNRSNFESALKITLIYVAFGVLWIYLSDMLVALSAQSHEEFWRLETYKGWLYVVLTGALLFAVSYRFLVRRALKEREMVDEIRAREALLHTIVHSTPDAVFVKDMEGNYRLFNEGAGRLVGKTPEQVIGRDDAAIFDAPTAERIHAIDIAIIQEGTIRSHEELLRTASGEEKYFWVTKGPLYDAQGEPIGLFGISHDITLHKKHEEVLRAAKERFEHLAHYDMLTRLPNRLSMIEKLEALTLSRDHFMLLVLDMDNFKHINDSYGHRFGDRVIVQTSKLLEQTFGQEVSLMRTGGDEFAMILGNTYGLERTHEALRRLREHLSAPFRIDQTDLSVSLSIGIARFPDDAADAQSLLRNADAAMFDAKHKGKNTYSFYEPRFTRKAIENATIAAQLKIALKEGGFSLCYQPQINPRDGSVIGAEALLRWSGNEAQMPPSFFIPIAEESGLICDLGSYVIRQGVQDMLQWQRMGLYNGKIALNVSARQLIQPDFLKMLDAIMQELGASTEHFELEITESVVLEYPEKTVDLLRAIKDRGFDISLDDFGTGYSSLAYLTQLPIDKLKIDRSFIRKVVDDDKGRAVVAAIIALGKALGISVLAEGVEYEAELAFLRESGIDAIQGYYYYRPLTHADFESLLRTKQSEAAALASNILKK